MNDGQPMNDDQSANWDMGDGDSYINQNFEPIIAPGGSRVTNITESPRSQMDELSDRHVNKRMAIPDFSLSDGSDVYCLVADTLDEQASTYDQIMKSPHRDQWIKAMKEEMKSINGQQTWILKPLPDGKKSIGSRWLFKIKRTAKEKLKDSKPDFVQKVLLKWLELILMKHMLLLQK